MRFLGSAESLTMKALQARLNRLYGIRENQEEPSAFFSVLRDRRIASANNGERMALKAFRRSEERGEGEVGRSGGTR